MESVTFPVREVRSASQALRGSLSHHIAHEFLSNSAHFPLANILLEVLLQGRTVFTEPGIYALLCGGIIQAWVLGIWESQGKGRRFVGNLIGPVVYSLFEFLSEGMNFLNGINHQAYWVFSIGVGVFAALGYRYQNRAGEVFVVLENLVRTLIMLGMYWVFEMSDKPENISPSVFFKDGSHVFFALVVVSLGIIIGFERVNSRRHMQQLGLLTTRLGEYSEWLLGRELLSRALSDPEAALGLRRRSRHVLFMDIRGFTAWSETHAPELVVDMLNRYFSLSEEIWQQFQAVKAKYTGDEVMAVFATGEQAAGAASVFMQRIGPLLAESGLAAGIGIHCGPLMEGALGSSRIKAYDVIGDTVNTAKRLCDNAHPGEILISQAVHEDLDSAFRAGPDRFIQAKGKREPIKVCPLLVVDAL